MLPNELDENILDLLRRAHIKSGAPGDIQYANTDGLYRVKLQYGEKVFRWKLTADRKGVSVDCSWSIAGDKQRKRATYRPD